MLAVTIQQEQLVIAEHPDPLPEAGEVLVRVHAAGLNGADQLQLRGAYPPPPGSPSTFLALSWPARLSPEVLGLNASMTVTA